MYYYLYDKEFLHKMRALSGKIMQSVCHFLKEDYDIGANFYLVGSGAKNLILQNANNPVDLDYNLEIVRCEDFKNCRYLKECARKSFNKALQKYGLHNCEDSTSSLTSKLICFNSENNACNYNNIYTTCFYNNKNNRVFSIDICITTQDTKNNYYKRLIHEKTGFVSNDKYYWNIVPQSKALKKKAEYIKKCGKWSLVRQQYINIKNNYLSQNDYNHPSFVCYVEAVNNVYNSRNHW